MRTTIDIPDETYRALKIRAASEGTTVRQLVLEGVELVQKRQPSKKRFQPPLIPSARPGSIDLTNEQIYDLIGFP